MIDARLCVGLPFHPKTKKLIKRLGTDAAWRLVCLFLWVAQNKSDGDLIGMTSEDIELAVDWAGEDSAFTKALVDVGFIEGNDEAGYSVHDWHEHNPWAAGADARSEKARWAAICKQHGRHKAAELMPEYADRLLNSAGSKQQAVPESASSTPLAESSCAPSPSPSPSPSPKEEVNLNPIVVSELTPCPHQEIISIFSELLPELPQPRVWDGVREKNLKSRWKWVLADLKKKGKTHDKISGLEFFRRMFSYIAKSDFLMGRKKDWACSLPWIVEAGNFAKIIEGNFEQKEAEA